MDSGAIGVNKWKVNILNVRSAYYIGDKWLWVMFRYRARMNSSLNSKM